MSLDRIGYVGLFGEPLGRERVAEIVTLWIDRFGGVEQATGPGSQVVAQRIRSGDEVVWSPSLEFRVTAGEQFTWVYLTPGRHVMETSGLAPNSGSALCRDVLADLPGCLEIIDDRNDRRLDELEARGLM